MWLATYRKKSPQDNEKILVEVGENKAMMVRDATDCEIDGIIAIDHIAATKETRQQDVREWVRKGCAIVALVDERVVGYAVLEYSFFSCGFISMLIVQEAYRRRGIATALVKRLEETCSTAKLFTSTNESNAPMRALMSGMSYEPSGVVYNLDEGDPELFYFKRITKNGALPGTTHPAS
ncbi:MAG: GNAT family N-acetyltransferase [Cyanobacteria bacterium P01_F01_bin.153]